MQIPFKYINKHTLEKMNYFKTCINRKLNFRTHRRKLSFCMKLYNKFFKNKVIEFGNYKRGDDSIIKTKRHPIQWFKDFILRQGVIMMDIDEYNTSILCSTCFNILHKYSPRSNQIVPLQEGKSVPYSKLKACSTCKNKFGKEKIMHRDSNAAINMAKKSKRNLVNMSEPSEFERAHWKDKIFHI